MVLNTKKQKEKLQLHQIIELQEFGYKEVVISQGWEEALMAYIL